MAEYLAVTRKRDDVANERDVSGVDKPLASGTNSVSKATAEFTLKIRQSAWSDGRGSLRLNVRLLTNVVADCTPL